MTGWDKSKDGWRLSTWGNEIELKYGKAIRDYKSADKAYPVYGTNGQVGTHTDYLAPGPGVILGRKGAYRGVHYSDQPFFVIDTAYYVKPISEMDMRWLYYAMKYYKVGEIDDGSPIPSTTRAAVYTYDFWLPPVSEQNAISDALAVFDDKIELNRQMNETLEGMAREVFRDWFVDFGPTRRKMAGEVDPVKILGGAITAPPQAQKTAALFPGNLGENGLPEGWERLPIGEISNIAGGGTPSTKNEEFWLNGQHQWATPRDLSKLSGIFISDTERKLTDSGIVKVSSGLSSVGSVLMSSRAPIGYLAIASVPIAVNQGFIVMRPTKRFPTYFAKLWCEENMETIEANANGSTFQEISKKNFKPILVTSPNEGVLNAFSEIVGALYNLIANNEIENQTLAEMRDLLLPKLMSGEISLREGA
ncbi:MAG: restriction endonuclease subunit S [Rhodobacteraceae bacterium]|nr:restriction endonuclease subunit S [Paracoccaceae bacterium]